MICRHYLVNAFRCFSSIEKFGKHVPVMKAEVLANLKPLPSQTVLDMTFGAGGHTREILKVENTKLLVLDRDPVAFELAKELQEEYPPGRVTPLLGRFSELPKLLQDHNVRPESIDGILFDLGCSSMQFDTPERGFSISKNGPLDMRMDKDRFLDQPTAAQILSKIDEPDLAKIIKVYGEEKNAKKIARGIIEARHCFRRIDTTKELTDIINACCVDEQRTDKLHRFSSLATKTFQALRIFVNNELNEINYGMVLARRYLKIGGRMVTLTFHSLEDTIVKRHLMGNVSGNVANPLPLRYMNSALVPKKEEVTEVMESNWSQIHKHVLTPSHEEVDQNPRSRSAKLRAAIRIS